MDRNEDEMIFLSCLKFTWTDPPPYACVLSVPLGVFFTRTASEKLNSQIAENEKLK